MPQDIINKVGQGVKTDMRSIRGIVGVFGVVYVTMPLKGTHAEDDGAC